MLCQPPELERRTCWDRSGIDGEKNADLDHLLLVAEARESSAAGFSRRSATLPTTPATAASATGIRWPPAGNGAPGSSAQRPWIRWAAAATARSASPSTIASLGGDAWWAAPKPGNPSRRAPQPGRRRGNRADGVCIDGSEQAGAATGGMGRLRAGRSGLNAPGGRDVPRPAERISSNNAPRPQEADAPRASHRGVTAPIGV